MSINAAARFRGLLEYICRKIGLLKGPLALPVSGAENCAHWSEPVLWSLLSKLWLKEAETEEGFWPRNSRWFKQQVERKTVNKTGNDKNTEMKLQLC